MKSSWGIATRLFTILCRRVWSRRFIMVLSLYSKIERIRDMYAVFLRISGQYLDYDVNILSLVFKLMFLVFQIGVTVKKKQHV